MEGLKSGQKRVLVFDSVPYCFAGRRALEDCNCVISNAMASSLGGGQDVLWIGDAVMRSETGRFEYDKVLVGGVSYQVGEDVMIEITEDANGQPQPHIARIMGFWEDKMGKWFEAMLYYRQADTHLANQSSRFLVNEVFLSYQKENTPVSLMKRKVEIFHGDKKGISPDKFVCRFEYVMEKKQFKRLDKKVIDALQATTPGEHRSRGCLVRRRCVSREGGDGRGGVERK